MIAEAAEGLPHVLQVHVSTQARPQQQQQGDDHQAGFSFWNMSDSSQNSNNGTDSSSCMTEPKTGYGADDGLAGKPHSCGPGLAWCNGFTTANAAACAAACCAVKPTGTSTAVCGGYTWDSKQADTSGGTRCPVGGPCCWLKMSPSALGKGPARYKGAIRASALPKHLKIRSLEYSWGEDMVVAPVFTPTVNGSVQHSVWIPPGLGWIRWQTGKLYVGPQVMTQEFTQEEIPVFVRAGAVIPLKTMEAVHELAPRTLVLQVVLPDNGAVCAGNTTVYEDDGVSMEYQDTGAFRTMYVAQTSNSSCTDVRIAPHSGGDGYTSELTERSYNIELLRQAPVHLPKVTVDGVDVPALSAPDLEGRGWWRSSFGPNQVPTLVVGTGMMDAAKGVAIEVSSSAAKTDDSGMGHQRRYMQSSASATDRR